MRILLATLPAQHAAADSTTPEYYGSTFIAYPPLGLLTVAALVPPEHEVSILDASRRALTIDAFVNEIVNRRPDLVGFSVMTRQAYVLRVVSRMLRQRCPELLQIAGGPHISSHAEAAMRNSSLDYACTGFAEHSFAALLGVLAAKADTAALAAVPGLFYRDGAVLRRTAPAPAPACIDDFPLPRRDLLPAADYYTLADRFPTATMFSSRGCPYRCRFCSVQEETWHYRSPARIVEEMRVVARAGYRGVHFFDDTFNIDRARVMELCRQLQQEQLPLRWSVRGRVKPFDEEMADAFVAAGGYRWAVGIESLDQRQLDWCAKGIEVADIERFFGIARSRKIETVAYLMLGLPGETAQYRQELYRRVQELGATYVYFNVLFPLPGTAYYRELLADGIYPRDYWQDFIDDPTADFVLPPPRPVAEQQQLQRLADWLSFRYYCTRPRFLWREVMFSIRNPRLLAAKARAYLRLVCCIPLRIVRSLLEECVVSYRRTV